MSLEESLQFDDLHKVGYDKCNTYIHKRHRWTLYILHHAQSEGWLPTPCDLVLFDRHADGVTPSCIDEIKKMRLGRPTETSLLTLCHESLSPNNDDWLIAGMELGLIRNCVMFGVHDRHGLQVPEKEYTDHQDQPHLIESLWSPEGALGYQGRLSDTCYKDRDSHIWDILRWRYSQKNDQFSFGRDERPIWVDFDLDVFSIPWYGHVLPWNDDVFCSELLVRSEYSTTNGWSAKEFIQGLLDVSGLFTIATEPNHCGGHRNMLRILERFNRFVFDNALKIPPLSQDDD